MVYYERNLPHWHPEGRPLFLTWRLHGSLPVSVVKAFHESSDCRSGAAFARFDRKLNEAAYGPVWLKNPEIAQTVDDAIAGTEESSRCVVHAFVIMPNHVHMLIAPKSSPREITKAIKGHSARTCNLLLHRTGQPFWNEETYDHWVRNAKSFERIRLYIEHNPVAAGLVKSPENWPWSSASIRGRG
jgi:putative transposase